MDTNLLFGKNTLEGVVSCEVDNNQLYLFLNNGEIIHQTNSFWILSPKKHDYNWTELKGNLYYKYARTFDNEDSFQEVARQSYKNDWYVVRDSKEAAMLTHGFTYYKGLKIQDITVLSFDIEATTLEHNSNSKVLLISNTLRKNGHVTKKLFAYDEYESQGEMIDAWCAWVRQSNPSILTGHNIYMYDIPYLDYVANMNGTGLNLGSDLSEVKFDNYQSKFRKDGSQFYEYTKFRIFGREIIDTFFSTVKYDVGRKYSSYKLKTIIAEEGLEKKGRTFYDASKIRDNYTNPEEWAKIKEYAKDDADDGLALFDLTIPSYFYLAQSVPMPFDSIINRASGAQINSIMVRSYLQNFHSLPKADESKEFEGAISFGSHGVFHNALKVDVVSLYPSIMRQYKVYDKDKDPDGNFLKLVEYFTTERLKDKAMFKETGEKHYEDMSNAKKIIANSCYGFLGANRLLFNSPSKAAFITEKGREVLTKSINWAKDKGYNVFGGDTDSIIFNKFDKPFLKEEREKCLNDINSLYPELIKFDDDGFYKSVLYLKAKNYVLDDGKSRKIKGSALKATTKEKALQEFIKELIDNLLSKKKDQVIFTYIRYVQEIFNLKDISRWVSKKTITDKILNPERSNEQKVFNAIEDTEYQLSDKIYVYFDINDQLKLQEYWNNDHNKERLIEKLYKTLQIFETVLDIDCYPNFKLKRNVELLEMVI